MHTWCPRGVTYAVVGWQAYVSSTVVLHACHTCRLGDVNSHFPPLLLALLPPPQPPRAMAAAAERDALQARVYKLETELRQRDAERQLQLESATRQEKDAKVGVEMSGGVGGWGWVGGLRARLMGKGGADRQSSDAWMHDVRRLRPCAMRWVRGGPLCYNLTTSLCC